MNVIKKSIDFLLSKTITLIVIILLLCVIWQVLARWFGISSSYTDETARFMFIWSGLFGAALAHGQARHLAIDLLSRKMTGIKQKILKIILSFLVIFFAGLVMIYGGVMVMNNTQGQISAVMQIPMWIVYIAIPTSGSLIIFYSLYDLIMMSTSTTTELS